MRDPLDCDDPIAARRYAYARSAAKDGEWPAAAEVLEQTLELAPRWAAAWFALGEAREKLGDRNGAGEAFRSACDFDPEDSQGAAARLALLGQGEATGLPPAYVARLFDDYAPRFDAHLKNDLVYRGPELILAALDRLNPERRFQRAIDLGCGTGLAGVALRGRVRALIGVDLSPGMIAKARETALYDSLEVGDIEAFLATAPAQAADLVVAADVLVYLGDVSPVFAAVARALAPDGLFAFSVEIREGEGYRLGPTMRFAHSEAHVREAAARARLRPLLLAPASVRREAGRDVAGRVGVFALE